MEQIQLPYIDQPTHPVGRTVAILRFQLRLLANMTDVTPKRQMDPAALRETCEQLGLRPVPRTSRDCLVALLSVGPRLLHLLESGADNPGDQYALARWRHAVERDDYDGARVWLTELGLNVCAPVAA